MTAVWIVLLLLGSASAASKKTSTDPTEQKFFSSDECNWELDPYSQLCKTASKTAAAYTAKHLHDHNFSTPVNLFNYQQTKPCALQKFGNKNSDHYFCDRHLWNESKPCIFYSFGTNNDYSFDKQLSENWQCRGVMLDPSVTFQSILTKKLHFFSIGANMLNDEDRGGPGTWIQAGTTADEWYTTSPPQLRQFLKHEKIDALKMDCEGCEYAVSRDVARHDPRFFKHVQQFTFEAHVSRNWMKTPDHFHWLGMLFYMLYKENFFLTKRVIAGCYHGDESLGCSEEMLSVHYPCGAAKMCQEYSFAKLT